MKIKEQFPEFDRTTLMDFYHRMAKAVGRYSTKPLITGGNIYCSSNVRTGIRRLDREENKETENKAVSWGKQIYAPHGYDSVVDSDRYENFSRENVERLFADKRSSQEELGLPTIVGECQIDYKLEALEGDGCYVFVKTEQSETVEICING